MWIRFRLLISKDDCSYYGRDYSFIMALFDQIIYGRFGVPYMESFQLSSTCLIPYITFLGMRIISLQGLMVVMLL